MTQASTVTGSARIAEENRKSIARRNLRTGLLFTAPALIVLAVFVFYPAIETFIVSLTNNRINRAGKFIGFENYVKLFHSADFWTDVRNTLFYAVLYAPLVVIVALAFALLLNRKDLKFVGFFRTCMFLPFVISLTVAAIAWNFILSPSLGLVPYWASQLFGIEHLNLLGTRSTAMATIVFITVWKNFGYFMVIFLAGLQGISAELYEAASLDGANWWQRFRAITLPSIKPEIFVVALTCTIAALKVFGPVQMLTRGGPGTSTTVPSYYSYKQFFQSQQVGYGAAIATALTIVIVIVSIAFTNLQEKVAKEDEE